MRSRLRRFALRLLLLVVTLLLLAGLTEGVCSAVAWFQYRTLNVADLNALDLGNVYVAEAPGGYTATLEPHPYLGWVNRPKAGGGFGGKVFPLRKDPEKFTVLLTGGSVGNYLARKDDLERALNRYDFGKPVVVLNGTNGAWKEPHQMIVTGLYGDVADAVITLDGFNEHWRLFGDQTRLEVPGNSFAALNPILKHGTDRLAAAWESQRLREFSQLHNSRALFYFTKAVRNQILADLPELPAGEEAARFFDLPESWPEEERNEFNLGLYKKYMRSVNALAKVNGCRVAHFIQPCPAIGKKLTPEEIRAVGKLDYADMYRRMTDRLLSLNGEGLQVVSLLDCFDSVNEQVYVDMIHNNKSGTQILAERISADVARLWNIKKR